MPKFFLLLFVLTLFSCKTEPVDLNSVAKELNKEMENAFRSGDLKALAAMYSDDGYLLSPRNKVTHGRAAIDAYWERFHTPIDWNLDVIAVSEKEDDLYLTSHWQGMAEKPKHWETEDIDISNAEVFYQLGHSKLQYESDDAVHRTSHVDFIIVWKKVGNEWKIFIDTYI